MNFEQNQVSAAEENPFHEVIMSPNEVADQLNISEERHNEALKKLLSGNLDDLEYLQETQKVLIGFKKAFEVEFGTVSVENRATYDRVVKRLEELKRVLKSVAQ